MQPGADVDPPSLGRELQGVGQEVQEHLFDPSLAPAKHPKVLVDRAPKRDPRRVARSRTRMRALSMALGRSKSVVSSSIRPASIFERSRMSLMRDRRCRPDSRMSWRYSVCFSLMSPNFPANRTSENPMMAFSGVRSSCDMLARNSDLWRLAASSWWLLSAISRKSRAFWMARADWVANVFRTSTTSGGNSPGAFRLKDRLPMI